MLERKSCIILLKKLIILCRVSDNMSYAPQNGRLLTEITKPEGWRREKIAVMSDRVQINPQGDRRQFRRFPMQLLVQAVRDDLLPQPVQAVHDARPETVVNLEICDFSLGGLHGLSSVGLKPQERITLTMPPFGTRPELSVTGRVVRCSRELDRFDIGIEFCQTNDQAATSPWLRLPELFYMASQNQRQ